MNMEYSKVINVLDKTQNESSKFRRWNWIEITDELRRIYNFNNQVKFKTSTITSHLYDDSDAYIHV